MKYAALHYLFAAFVLAGLQTPAPKPLFSGSATPLEMIAQAPDGLSSPDGTKRIMVKPKQEKDEIAAEVLVTAKSKVYHTTLGSLVNAEFKWSPDSRAFFITYSDGGNVGTYHVKVVYVDSFGVREREPVPNGRKLFTPRCLTPEHPNVGGITWLGGATRLLIAVEVPPHSSCSSMGTFRAYEISIPDGKILRQYGQLEAKRLFGSELGDELKASEDRCVTTPKSCVSTGMRSEKRHQTEPRN